MSTHYAILQAVRAAPTNTARLNVVSTPPGSSQITFTVFPKDGSLPISEAVTVNASGYATSYSATNPAIKNLFSAAGGLHALVRAQAPVGDSTAVLEEAVSDGKMSLVIPAVEIAGGLGFSIPAGDLFARTCVLVGNPNSSAIEVTPRYGTAAPLTPIDIPAWGTTSIQLTQGDTLFSLVGANPTFAFIAQISVDPGTPSMSVLLPRT